MPRFHIHPVALLTNLWVFVYFFFFVFVSVSVFITTILPMLPSLALHLLSFKFLAHDRFGTYISFLAQYGITAIVITLVGFAARIPFFTDNSFVSYAVLFFLWGNVVIAHAVFFAPFFKNAETGIICGWLFVIVRVRCTALRTYLFRKHMHVMR